jgi:hypothetical protein
LLPVAILAILDNVRACTVRTLIGDDFSYHAPILSSVSLEPLPYF